MPTLVPHLENNFQSTKQIGNWTTATCSLSSSGNQRQPWVVQLTWHDYSKIPPETPLTFWYPHSPGHLEREDSLHPRRRQAEVSSQALFSALPTVFCLPVQHHEGPRGCCLSSACGPLSQYRAGLAICSPLSVATHTVVRSPAHMLGLRTRVKLENIEWDLGPLWFLASRSFKRSGIDLGCRLS